MRKFMILLFAVACMTHYAQTTDASGRKQGYWKKKDEKTGKLLYEGEFKDDKPIGRFNYFYPNDSLRAVLHFRLNGTVYARLFHMLSGKRMAEGRYINKETKDSVWTYYDDAGTLISRERFKNGKKEGAAFVYFPDGKISEEKFFKNDLQEGEYKQYFDEKRLRSKGAYVNGQLHGRVVYYFPNGTEAAAGSYVNGKKNGPWIYRSSNGKINDKELYNSGRLAGKKETDEFFSKNRVPETQLAPAQGTVLPTNNSKKIKK